MSKKKSLPLIMDVYKMGPDIGLNLKHYPGIGSNLIFPKFYSDLEN
jgi:hypothetical protein